MENRWLASDDALLMRTLRFIKTAKVIVESGNARRIRLLEADLRAAVEKLDKRAKVLGQDIEIFAHLKRATSAYSRCFNLVRR
jgi:hypothetical protein